MTNGSDFQNQVVVITGGTRGIGAALTKEFIAEGSTVIATYSGNDEAALSLKESLGEKERQLHLRKFNVAIKSEVDTFWQWIQETFSQVDILVNNAGIRRDQILASMGENEWDDVLNINLKGTYLMAQGAVLLMMKKRYGRIINMSSIGGVLGLPGQANYAASKAGQMAMAKSLAKEVAKRGITVNNVCPGFIETELLADLPSEQVKAYQGQVPLRRFGKTEEVAYCVKFLASPRASYITGTCLEVTGGLS